MTGQDESELRALQARVAGRYSIEREVGRGGMGIVFLARDVALDRRVAIKLLPAEYVAQETLRARFLREARLAARLSHPHIVPVFAVEDHADAVFYVMGYVEGESLAARIGRVGQLAPAEVITIIQQVAWALAYAHTNGVVHRDVKPDNILIERGTGRAWVMDFGIARAREAQEGSGAGIAATRLTQVGHVLGTAAYMSPEQASGEDVDGRSDLYSLGIVAYQALTGRLPLEATSAQALLAKHLTETPAPVASVRPGVPAALARTVDQLLAKDPAARPATGEAVADALAAGGAGRSEVAPAVRNFLRAGEQEVVAALRFGVVIGAIGASQPKALLGMFMALFGTMAGSVGALFFRARRLAVAGYRWPDIRDSVPAYANERAEENREVAVPPDRAAMRAAALRAGVSLVAGLASFIGAIVLANNLRRDGARFADWAGLALVLLGSMAFIVATMPLAYWIAMRSDAKRPGRKERRGPGLALLGSPFGRMLFSLASRDVTPLPPRDVAGALDLLLVEVEGRVAAPGRAAVRGLRGRLDHLAREAHALRVRERELDRAIAEAGHGPTADALTQARGDVASRIERIATLTDAARLKLLLVRSAVAPPSDLDALARLD